jgi:hypothetical protein
LKFPISTAFKISTITVRASASGIMDPKSPAISKSYEKCKVSKGKEDYVLAK